MREFEFSVVYTDETRGPREPIKGDDPFHAAEDAARRVQARPLRAIEIYEHGNRVLTWKAPKGKSGEPGER